MPYFLFVPPAHVISIADENGYTESNGRQNAEKFFPHKVVRVVSSRKYGHTSANRTNR